MNKNPQKTLAYYENLGAQLSRPQTLSDYEKLGESLIPKQPQNILSPVASGRRQNNIVEGFISGAKAQGSGLLGGLASWAGGENAVTNYLDEVMRDNQRDREFDGYSWDYFTDPSGFAYDLGGLLGSQGAMAAVTLPLMAIPGVNAGVAGAASALPRLLASRAVTNKAAQYGLENALKKGIQASTVSSPLVKYGITSAPVEAFSEGGQAIKRAVQEGYENPYMQGLEVAAKNMPVLLAGNALEMGLLGRGFAGLKGVAGESIGKRAAKGIPHIAGYGAAQGLLQSGEEVMQERAQESTFGDPTGGFLPSSWTEDEKQAFQATFAPGAFMGMLGAIPGAVRTRQNKNSNDAVNNSTNNSFDTNLFDKWESRPGATDLDNVRPEIKGALNSIAQELGNGGKITITGGAEKGYHASGEFGHEGGWKVDIDKNSITDPQKFFALCEKYGIAVGDEGDHYDLSAHKEGSTGGKRVATPSTFLSDMVNGGENVTAGKREGHENAWAIYDVFREAGYSDNAIAGILGRVQQEHNFDTSNVEEYDDAETGLHLGGYGMFQWNGGRTTAFLNWAKENNLDPQNARVQAQYALLEARQRGLTPEKMNSLSDEDAATLWTDEWEVGKHGNERKYAKEWAERIAKGGNINSQNNISVNNNVDTSLIDGAETAQDNSALMKQLNDIMAEGEIGLSHDQRMALINMATEQKQIPLPNATPQEEETYYREIDDAINNGDYKTIARMFPQQTARILGINPINTSTPKIDALKQAQEEQTQPQPQIDTQPLAQIQKQQQQPIEQNVVPPMSQNIAGDIENIISQIRSGTFNTGAELNTNQQAVLDLLSQPAQNVIPTQDGLSAGLTAAQKVAQANAAIANFRANEEARAQEEQPAPTVRKYHFDGTQQAQEQAEEAAPIATQDEIIPQEQAETQNKRQLRPMREMYDNAKNVFKNFRDASDAIIAGYEGGYVGRDEAEEMLRQGHSDLRGNLTTKKNASAFNKLLDATITRLNATQPQAQTAQSEQEPQRQSSETTETSGANRVNDIREYYNDRKEEYRTFELDELEARRKRYIKERVDHYNKNPGGQGTNSVLLDADGNPVSGADVINARKRVTESNNPEWYQRAYAMLGRKPAKKDYEYIAETDLSEWQPAEVQADWQALNEVIEEKKNEEQIKAEPKNVQKFRKDVNQKVRDYKKRIKDAKDKKVSRENYLAKIKEMHDNALRVATQDETRKAINKVYYDAVSAIGRIYDDMVVDEAEAEYLKSIMSESAEEYINERHKDQAQAVREALYQVGLGDNGERVTTAKFIEDLAKTSGITTYYEPPKQNGLVGEGGLFVFQNDEMKKQGRKGSLDMLGYDYLKYLLDKNGKNTAQVESIKNGGITSKVDDEEYIYFRTDEGRVGRQVVDRRKSVVYNGKKLKLTKENILNTINERGFTTISGKEYQNANEKYEQEIEKQKRERSHKTLLRSSMELFQWLIENKRIEDIFRILLDSANRIYIEAASNVMGIKLSHNQNKREQQLIEYFGYNPYQNNNVASEATTEKPQTKKAAKEGGQENVGEASNTENNKTEKGGVVVTGNEFGEYKDIKELRKKTVDYYSKNLQGTSVENKTLGRIDIDENGLVNFTGAGKREFKSTSAKAHKLLLVKYLPTLIENATNITSNKAVKERHANETFYYLHTEASIEGKNTPVEITLVKRNDGSIQYYNHTLPTEENKNDAPVSPGPVSSSNEALGTPAVGASSVDSTIPQTEPTSKDKNSTKQDTKQKERSQNEDALSDVNKNITASYSDKSGVCKGTLKNGVITIWRKDMKKGEWNFTVSADEINKIMYGSDNPYDNKKAFKSFEGKRISGGNANINYLWHTIAKAKVHDTNENWIEGSKTDKLKGTRRKYYEESGGKDAIGTQNLAESAARVMRNLYEQTQGARLKQDTRGIYDTANNIVTLTENADESTFIHEMGHHYYNVLKQAAKIAGKNSQAAKDVETIDNWANYKKGMAAEYEDTASEKEFADLEKEITEAEEKGDTKKANELKARWGQERWARGVEEYFNEGIAPTAKLRKIFDNFKKWLKEIYRGLRGAGAKPSDDVRAVMERMIASDKEILSGKASRLTGDTKAAYDKALADLNAAGVKNAEANAYIAAKMAERLSNAYKEAGEDRSAVSLLPEIQAQEKSAQNEKEAVRKKYEGTKKWLKAPNGEDTNLTEDQWLTVRTPSFKKWFGDWENDPKNASKVVDENDEPKVIYHGTARADRVGDIFRPDRATSGPMAFFTDSLEVGTNYSRDKADTSLSREDLDEYKNQFTVEVKGRNGKSETVNIVDYWKYLSPKERMNIAKKAEAIGYNDDYEITLKSGNKHGTGDYVHSLREAKGNHLEALINEWLYNGNLYNEEGEFLEVLKLAGVENVKYNDPDYREEAVYSVFMNCRNPMNTTKISDKLYTKLEEASEEAQENYDPDEAYGADMWDKTNISPEDWIERLSDDRENETTYAWTIIPDWVTETLKKEGYDGIEDAGGKYSGLEHTVYIPFSSTQIKSATDNNGEFNENDPSILHQFAGEKSKTANISKLNEAKEMEERGESKENIYKATGWIKGKDDKWRYEIPDNLDKIDFSELLLLNDNEGISLDEIYDNYELYRAYPWLRDVPVMVTEGEEGTFIQTKKFPQGVIRIGREHIDGDTSDNKSVLVHEIQHAIQHYEKFATGGSSEGVKYLIRKELDNLYTGLEKNNAEYLRLYNRVNEKEGKWLENFDDEDEKELKVAEKDLKEYAANLPKGEEEKIKNTLRRISELRRAIKQPLGNFALYERLGGEQEARESQRRATAIETSTPTIHDKNAIIIFGGQEFSANLEKSAKSPIDNNGKMKDNVINDYLTIKANGSFAVKLLNEKPPLRTESEKERIHRRKEEVSNMDKLLNVKENPDAYAELLSDHTVDAIEKRLNAEQISYDKLAKEFLAQYNSNLAKYSEIVDENRVIGSLYILKGAMRYAEQQGNIARRNKPVSRNERNAGRNISEVGRTDTETTRQLNTETTKHSNTSAFSIAEKGGKFTAKLNAIPKGKEKQLANIAGLHHGKASGDTFTFDNEGERVEFIRKAEAFLSTADEDTKLKFSVDAWHGNGLYELIDKFSLKYLGTGEGAQVHGWGLYFAKSREVGEGYRNKLNLDNDKYYIVNGKEISLYDTNAYLDLSSSSKIAIGALRLHKDNAMKAISELESWQYITNEEKINAIELLKDGKVKGSEKNKHGGHLYHVQIPDEDVMLDEQKTFEEQPQKVREAVKKIYDEIVPNKIGTLNEFKNGNDIYGDLLRLFQDSKTVSETLNTYGIKGITYDGQQDGRCYVVFDDNAVDIIEKFSAEKLKETSIAKLAAKADIVKMEDLTAEEKRFMEMGEKLGTPVVWVSADPRLNGWHKDGVTFINRNRRMTGEQTFWHEALHFILQNEDGLLSELADTVGITDKQIEAWKNKTGRFELSREEVVEEMLCDAFHDPASRVKVFQEIAGKNPSLMEKIMAWINRLKEEFFDAFRGVQGKLTQSQKNNMTRVIDNHFKNLKGKDGKPLFKRKGKEWTLANGESLESRIAASGQGENRAKSPIENTDNVGDNKNNSRLSDMQKTAMYADIERAIDNHIKAQVKSGAKLDDILAELTSEHSAHRQDLFHRVRSQIQDLKAHLKDDDVKRRRISTVGRKDPSNWSKETVDTVYNQMISELEGVLDYGGVLYREIALDRRRNKGVGGAVVSWQSAEVQRAKREGVKSSSQQNTTNTKHSANIAGASFSASVDSAETEQGVFEKAAAKLAKKMGLKSDIVKVEAEKADTNDISMVNYLLRSPSRIKGTFGLFFRMGKKAMDTLTKNRSDFLRKLDAALNTVKTDKEKQDLYDVLLRGDAEQKEFTKEELTRDYGENVANAYIGVRRLMTKAYRMLNDARRKPVIWTRRLTDKELKELQDNKFVEIKSVGEKESDGRRKITYKEYQNYKREKLVVDKKTLERFESDEDMQVIFKHKNRNGTFTVSYREGIGNVNKLTGYIPHFFHNYMIRVKDAKGKTILTLGSGKTEREAIKKAEEWVKNNKLEKGQQVYISPKTFNFEALGMDESQNAVVVGDKDYKKMMNSIAKGNDLTLDEAKDLLNGSVKMKNRHRFLGNLLQRKGVAGYETDLPWVLRHYLNNVARYHALETEFKPQAISLFERLFGDFNKEHKGLAQYVKDYIGDINGNPSAVEEVLNKALRNNILFKYFITPYFGDRAALQLSNTLTNWTSMLCLGYLNTSSALLNLSQCINAAGYLGSPKYAGKIIAAGFKHYGKMTSRNGELKRKDMPFYQYNLKERKILLETNVVNDIGLDSGSGYDINRGYAGKALGAIGKISQKGMILFKTTEQAMRRGTVLVAYEKARAEGKNHKQAIAYAKEINEKSNFDYSVADAPNIFRRGSIFSQLLLQFKKYGFKELEVMADMCSNATGSKQKLAFWGMYFIVCGLLQVPALDWLDKLLGENMKTFVQKSIMEVCGDSAIGQIVGKTAMYGVLSNFGVDISARAGMADVIPTDLKNLLQGPTISRAGGIVEEGGNLAMSLVSDSANGSVASFVRALSPGMYNIYSAATGEKVGKRDRVTSYYEGAWERILRAAGFQSTDERISSDMERIVSKERSGLTKEKQEAVDAFIANPTGANAKRLKELGVSPKTVKQERERKKQDRAGRMKGKMTAEEQKRYKEMMKFAE